MKKSNKPEIKAILFDLDNTIIKTSRLFFDATAEVSRMYAQILPNMSLDEITNLFAKIDKTAHAVLSVNPNRWKTIVPQLESALKVPKSKSIAEAALARLDKIYTEVPEFEPGAQAVLELAKEWGLLLGLVTHANVEWTLFKLEALGLQDAFDAISIISEDQHHKQPLDWVTAAERLPSHPSQTMVVGDNVISDVVAAVTAGFGAAVWIHDKEGWDVFKQGQLPPQAIEIAGIAQVPNLPHFIKFS